jgi:hypothetical protein
MVRQSRSRNPASMVIVVGMDIQASRASSWVGDIDDMRLTLGLNDQAKRTIDVQRREIVCSPIGHVMVLQEERQSIVPHSSLQCPMECGFSPFQSQVETTVCNASHRFLGRQCSEAVSRNFHE